MYEIVTDRERPIVNLTLGGMLTAEEVAEYSTELKRAFAAIGPGGYSLLIDLNALPVQHQDILHTMGRYMTGMPKAQAIAIVTGSSLARMQIRRLFSQPYTRITGTIEEGRAWIESGTEPSTH